MQNNEHIIEQIMAAGHYLDLNADKIVGTAPCKDLTIYLRFAPFEEPTIEVSKEAYFEGVAEW